MPNDKAIEKIVSGSYTRKSFLRFLGAGIVFLFSSGKLGRPALAQAGERLNPRKKRPAAAAADLAVAKGPDPAALTRKAVAALGGMGTFVKKGDVVVVKPNIGWDRTPEQAANTNPEVVAAVVRMCFEAGAKMVKVFDNTCAEQRRTYQNSGIADAVKKAGGTVFFVSEWKYASAAMPAGSLMADWPVSRDAATCDCFINVPIAKHHSLTRLTLSMKNLMGVCGGDRGRMHQNIDRKLVEMTAFIKPDLTIIDAYRILLRDGPSGGNLQDVEKKETVIASADPVLADAYATTLFGLSPRAVGSIPLAVKAGLGSMDIKKAKIKYV